MAAQVLSYDQARRFYDRFGWKQDLQRLYEDPALDRLISHAEFERSSAVVEFGCGTGRLAERLLAKHLPANATYAAFDLSQTMVDLAVRRVAPWSDRAQVRRTDGSPCLPVENRSCDRFLSTYVLDLLSENDIRSALGEARRVLGAGGRLCLAGLTSGRTVPSRVLGSVWSAVHSLRPQLVGGCRALDLAAIVASDWQILHQEVVCAYGICTDVVIAA